MKSMSFPSRIQREFEQLAFTYGVQPAVCTLLGEFIHRKLSESWKSGHRYGWSQASDRFGRPAGFEQAAFNLATSST